MSDLIVPNEAKINWAQAQIDDVPTLADCYLRLFKSAVIIDRETTLAGLEAAQCNFDGYAPIQLENWSDVVIVDTSAMTEPDTVAYEATLDSEDEVFGIYATNGAGDKLWFASPFPSAVPTPFSADLQISLELDLNSVFLN